jgi:hypothetical protein
VTRPMELHLSLSEISGSDIPMVQSLRLAGRARARPSWLHLSRIIMGIPSAPTNRTPVSDGGEKALRIFAHRRGRILIQAGIGARSYPIAIYSWTKSSGGSHFRRIFRVIYQLQPTCAHGPLCANIRRRTLCFGDLGMRELHLAALALVAGTTIVSTISTLASCPTIPRSAALATNTANFRCALNLIAIMSDILTVGSRTAPSNRNHSRQSKS